jgi:class 3 adenylate cyclase
VAERRVCSVLFCDLVGFTPLSESRDPEAVRELLSRYFGVARTMIGRYGGTVEKFIGDAVMAVWGTPTASERGPNAPSGPRSTWYPRSRRSGPRPACPGWPPARAW